MKTKQFRMAIVVLGLSATPAAFAQTVILDNTNIGTGLLNSSTFNSLSPANRKGILLSVDPTMVLGLTTMKLGFRGSGSHTFDAALYEWNGSAPTGSALATQQFNVSPTTVGSYYDFTFSGSAWSGIASGDYIFLVQNGTNRSGNSLQWLTLFPSTAPTATSGITYSGYRASTSSTFASSTSYNAIQLNGTVTSGAVPEPGEWAAMGILGAGLAGLVIRKRRTA